MIAFLDIVVYSEYIIYYACRCVVIGYAFCVACRFDSIVLKLYSTCLGYDVFSDVYEHLRPLLYVQRNLVSGEYSFCVFLYIFPH